jgi:hypothetical protein
MISSQSRRPLSWSQWAAGKLTWDIWQDWTCAVTKDSHSQILYHVKTRVELRTRMRNFHLFWYSLPNYAGPRSRGSVVGISTGYGLDDWGIGVRVRVWSRIFSSSRRRDRVWGVSPGVKRQGRETAYSPPTSAEVKKMRIYTSTPPYVFMV